MSTRTSQAEQAGPPAVVRLGWALVRSSAEFGWRLVQRQSPSALTAGPRGFAVRSRTSGALRSGGRDVVPTPEGLAAAFPHATGRLLVLVPDSSEDEGVWAAGHDVYGGTYASRLGPLLDWTPVHLRAAAPSADPDRAAELSAVLQRIVEHWPEQVERIAVIAHGDGGLAVRAAAGVQGWSPVPWTGLVTDMVLLGTPHLLAQEASRSFAVGRQLDEELAGIVTADRVLADVPHLEGVRYTVITRAARVQRNPFGALVGNLVWWRDRSRLRRRSARQLFPGAGVVHVEDPRAPLTNHPEVHQALMGWLA